jgi:hypothetical protein
LILGTLKVQSLIGPSQKIKVRIVLKQNRYVVISSFRLVIYLTRVELSPRIWDKVKSSWEHVGEHIENLRTL